MLETLSSHTHVFYPWSEAQNGSETNDQGGTGDASPIRFGSGIPPHVALLVTQRKLLFEFQKFSSGYDDRMTNLINAVFDDRNVANGSISEHRIRNIVSQSQEQFYEKLVDQIKDLTRMASGNASTFFTAEGGQNVLLPQHNSRTDERNVYLLHHHHGKLQILPKNFSWPKGTPRDVWRRWNLGDTVNGVPPLRILNADDVMFLKQKNSDSTGKKVRAPTKTLYELRTLCLFIKEEAQRKGVYPDDDRIQDEATCTRIFDQIASTENGLISGRKRKTQIQWRTTIKKVGPLRKKANGKQQSQVLTGTQHVTAGEQGNTNAPAVRGRQETTRTATMAQRKRRGSGENQQSSATSSRRNSNTNKRRRTGTAATVDRDTTDGNRNQRTLAEAFGW